MDHLEQFNRQVLLCQNDVYTLAWYLLEDETEAQAVMQEAVEAAYRCFSTSQANCRLRIMKQVVDQYRKRKRPAQSTTLPCPFPSFHFIAEHERLVVVLIDMIGLDYADTAAILGCSRKEIRCLLSQARWKMTVQMKFHNPCTETIENELQTKKST